MQVIAFEFDTTFILAFLYHKVRDFVEGIPLMLLFVHKKVTSNCLMTMIKPMHYNYNFKFYMVVWDNKEQYNI